MFSNAVRKVLMLLFLVLAAILLARKFYVHGLGMLMGFGLLMWGYFRNSGVFLAYWKLKAERYQSARRLISAVPRPDWLSPFIKGYYFYCKGHLAFEALQYDQARAFFERAIQHKIFSANDRALTWLNLAQLAHIQGEKAQALDYLKEAKSLKMNPDLKNLMDQFAKKL